MTHASYTQFRAHLTQFMDQVCQDKSPLVVTRQGGESVVVMSEAEFSGLQETLHLLASPFNAARLAESIAEFDHGRTHTFDPDSGAA